MNKEAVLEMNLKKQAQGWQAVSPGPVTAPGAEGACAREGDLQPAYCQPGT